jgi:hypothetical protein
MKLKILRETVCRKQWAGQGSHVVAAVASFISVTIIYNMTHCDKVTQSSPAALTASA